MTAAERRLIREKLALVVELLERDRFATAALHCRDVTFLLEYAVDCVGLEGKTCGSVSMHLPFCD